MTQPKTFSLKFFLPAGECDAEGRMPLSLIATRIIDVATAHANALGIGYSTLVKFNIGWVLSRLSIEMIRYPGINETYTMTTWIESINKRFSERNVMITDEAGEVVGYARTIWAAIDFVKRTGADLSAVGVEKCPVGDLDCPIEKTPRISALGEDADSIPYRFKYCDIDFNRHVNTVRYLELIMDSWSLDFYDKHAVKRFDMLFHHECYYGEEVDVRRSLVAEVPETYDCEVVRDGVRMVAARLAVRPRETMV